MELVATLGLVVDAQVLYLNMSYKTMEIEDQILSFFFNYKMCILLPTD